MCTDVPGTHLDDQVVRVGWAAGGTVSGRPSSLLKEPSSRRWCPADGEHLGEHVLGAGLALRPGERDDGDVVEAGEDVRGQRSRAASASSTTTRRPCPCSRALRRPGLNGAWLAAADHRDVAVPDSYRGAARHHRVTRGDRAGRTLCLDLPGRRTVDRREGSHLLSDITHTAVSRLLPDRTISGWLLTAACSGRTPSAKARTGRST